jgi:Na+-translocating ferredoxin:NAD+ oxidoreductase subunit B
LLGLCTGCELCIAPCPVDCITMVPRAIVREAPAAPQPGENRARFAQHNARAEQRASQRAALLSARKRAAATTGRPGT